MSTVHPKLANLHGLQESFLGHRLQVNDNYGFLPHYLYFLRNLDKWPASAQIQKRLLASVSTDCEVAWKQWREFRSAQAEVTSIYLVENYFRGNIVDLEVSRPGTKKSCDISVQFGGREALVYLEVKAQSGQQHGDKHPLSREAYLFTPQGEEDLMSWLFDPRTSSTTGAPMVPFCKQASDKGADALLAMIDIFQWKTTDLSTLGQYLVPDCEAIDEVIFTKTPEEPEFEFSPRKLTVFIIQAGAQVSKKMGCLREIWLFNDSALDKLLVIRAAGVSAVLPGA